MVIRASRGWHRLTLHGQKLRNLFENKANNSFPYPGVQLAINNNRTDYRLPTIPGNDQSLWCMVLNSSREEKLLWYRGDGQVSLKDGNNVNASNICVSPVTEDDNGVSFTCRLARDGAIQISVVLDVMCK